MIADTFAAALRQHRDNGPRSYRDVDCRDLSEAAVPYCAAKLMYAAGEDEAGDAAYGRFIDLTDSDEREQIEAELEAEYANIAAWASCITYEADRIKRDTAKLAVCEAALENEYRFMSADPDFASEALINTLRAAIASATRP